MTAARQRGRRERKGRQGEDGREDGVTTHPVRWEGLAHPLRCWDSPMASLAPLGKEERSQQGADPLPFPFILLGGC